MISQFSFGNLTVLKLKGALIFNALTATFTLTFQLLHVIIMNMRKHNEQLNQTIVFPVAILFLHAVNAVFYSVQNFNIMNKKNISGIIISTQKHWYVSTS